MYSKFGITFIELRHWISMKFAVGIPGPSDLL